jgi:hypothetical protein
VSKGVTFGFFSGRPRKRNVARKLKLRDTSPPGLPGLSRKKKAGGKQPSHLGELEKQLAQRGELDSQPAERGESEKQPARQGDSEKQPAQQGKIAKKLSRHVGELLDSQV